MTDQHILWIDPGKTTGFGILDIARSTHVVGFHGAELGHDEFLDWASRALRDPLVDCPWTEGFIGPITAVGIEGFVVGPRTIQQCPDDRSLWSVKQIGTVEMFCRWFGLPMIRQLPGDKEFGTDAKLKALGWYAPAPGQKGEAGHRRDAARHALKYAVDRQLIDLRSLLP